MHRYAGLVRTAPRPQACGLAAPCNSARAHGPARGLPDSPANGPGLRPARGFTLVEVAIVCALAGILAALTWPSLQPSLVRAGRSDAVTALTRVQQAQASHHALHGLYAHELRALGSAAAAISPQGLYRLALDEVHGDGYRASATAQPGSRQAADRDCTRLTLEVRRGFATHGPSTRCWQP